MSSASRDAGRESLLREKSKTEGGAPMSMLGVRTIVIADGAQSQGFEEVRRLKWLSARIVADAVATLDGFHAEIVSLKTAV